MTLPDSSGRVYAQRHKLPHEVFSSPKELPIRSGDTVLFGKPGHVAQVDNFDAATGKLTIIEGNWGNRVNTRTLDLSDPYVRGTIEGFGRPALGDFQRVE
jgi:hypothetical protein